jgi:hypothetical protein
MRGRVETMTSAATTLRPKPNKVPAPMDALALRAWARAYLWDAGEIKSVPEAVDPLQTFAVESGLVAEIGQDAVQKILADAFMPYRSEAPSADDTALFCDICCCAPSFTAGFCNLCREDEARRQALAPAPKSEERPTPRTTIEAIMYCVRERGLTALEEPDNIERLSHCDAAATAQINNRIEALLRKAKAA